MSSVTEASTSTLGKQGEMFVFGRSAIEAFIRWIRLFSR